MAILKKLFSSVQSKVQSKSAAITPRQARQMMDDLDEYVLLDVRSYDEYKQKRIDGAKLIPVDELAARAATELPDKRVPVFVYCRSGARAGTAVKMLNDMGYESILSIGGINDWPFETIGG